MCGIAGMAGFEDKNLLKRMCDSIAHRGPDDYGYFTDKNIGLGNRRLSIIDLEGGHQPIENEDGSMVIVYNGMVYNHNELRNELNKKGHRFKTVCDTEVVLHAYEEFGSECLKKMRGMFAFAIWDSGKKEIFIARDHIGSKPLYYTVFDGKLLFCSEIKGILQSEEVKRQPNLESMNTFMSYQFSIRDETLILGIKKLLPGHFMVFSGGHAKISKWWDASDFNEVQGDEKEIIKNMMDLLDDSVKSRLISDVPIGAFLSGGLDSSTIVGLMSKTVSSPVKTFTVGGDYDRDLEYAREVAEYFGTDHHEVNIEMKDVLKSVPEVIWYNDEPPPFTSIAVYLMSREARRKVKVVLSGEGGDENLSGYRRYKFMTGKYSLLPKEIRLKLYTRMFFAFTQNDKRKLYTQKYTTLLKTNTDEELNHCLGGKNLVRNFTTHDLKVQLPEILLMGNRMTMANGIEIRTPMLDRKFVEYCMSIPSSMKLKGSADKYIFRKAVSNLLPPGVVNRKKQTFVPPLTMWLRNGLEEVALNVLSETNLKKRGYFRNSFVKKIISRQKMVSRMYPRMLWVLMTYEIWHRMFIDQEKMNQRFNAKSWV